MQVASTDILRRPSARRRGGGPPRNSLIGLFSLWRDNSPGKFILRPNWGELQVLSQDFWILFPILLQDSCVFLTKKVLIWLLTEEIILVDGLCWVPGAGVSRSGRPPLEAIVAIGHKGEPQQGEPLRGGPHRGEPSWGESQRSEPQPIGRQRKATGWFGPRLCRPSRGEPSTGGVR